MVVYLKCRLGESKPTNQKVNWHVFFCDVWDARPILPDYFDEVADELVIPCIRHIKACIAASRHTLRLIVFNLIEQKSVLILFAESS